MAKRAQFDESGDSDELQALFDNFASSAPAKRRLEVISESDCSGDSDDLQALFDSVSTESTRAAIDEAPVAQASKAVADAPVAAAEAATQASAGESPALFQQLGQLTRSFHQALCDLGYDHIIEETAKAIPDARQRLSYVAQMTEQAASRVLNATDIAKPIQDELQRDAETLGARWEQVYANQLSVEGFKSLADATRSFFKAAPAKTAATNEKLLEIMMAQDFQDLTGQVIKRLADTSQKLETELLRLLVDFSPGERKANEAEVASLLNGPVIDGAVKADVVVNQKQVDDLLGSLGF